MNTMYINGEFTSGHAKETILVINPATEEVISEVPQGIEKDAASAVAAAKSAFDPWRKMPANERAEVLHQVSTKIRNHHNEIVELLTREEGKPIPESDEELWWVEETFDYYAEIARHERGRVIPPGDPDQFNFVLKEPWGVVGCIVPWNFPLLLLVWKIAPALAAGNTVVIKPSELTPLSTLRLVEVACDHHLPPGVINVVTGYGSEAGEPLVTHPDVDLDVAVSGLAYSALLNTGQEGFDDFCQVKHVHWDIEGKLKDYWYPY